MFATIAKVDISAWSGEPTPVRHSLTADLDGLIERQRATHLARVVNTEGDAAFVRYSEPKACLDGIAEIFREWAKIHPGRSLHAGITTGELRRVHSKWQGTPMIESSRLCDAAPSGIVLGTEAVVLETRGLHWQTWQTVQIDGKGAVPVWRLVWDPAEMITVMVINRSSRLDLLYMFLFKRVPVRRAETIMRRTAEHPMAFLQEKK